MLSGSVQSMTQRRKKIPQGLYSPSTRKRNGAKVACGESVVSLVEQKC
jgi:hypothetical protein